MAKKKMHDPQDLCFFCKKPLGVSMVNTHHKIPRRYYRSMREANENGNTVFAHISCHSIAHHTHDRPNLSKKRFIQYMEFMNWWEGIYSD